VVAARWWTHLGAITARGHKMHIAPSSLKSLRARLDPQHPMLTGFLASNDFPTLHKDDGNLSPLRRLLFAAGLSDSFLASNADPLQVLSRFRFVYVRCSEMSNGMNQESLKHHIERAEKELIARLAPLCNTKHVPRDATPVNVVCSDVEDLLMQAMKGKRTQASNPQPSDVLSVPVQPGTHEWADVFWQSLPPEPHFARALVDSLCALAQRNGVQVVYTGTKGSDLRFKVTTESGHHRVFMTLCWQKRVKRFLVRSACTVPQVQNFMGCCMPDESVVGTLPTEPLISEVRIAAEAQRIVVVRQIFLCSMASI